MKRIKNSVLLIFIILLAIVLAIVVSAFATFYMNFENSEKIASGVFIKGVNVSGMTKKEAKKAVTKYLNENASDHVTFSFENYQFDAEATQFEAQFDIDSAIDNAYKIGRGNNIVKNVGVGLGKNKFQITIM